MLESKNEMGCNLQPIFSLKESVVEKMGLEPTTSWLPAKRSSHLSYIPFIRVLKY